MFIYNEQFKRRADTNKKANQSENETFYLESQSSGRKKPKKICKI